jgi:hypothetical protein
LEGEFNPTKKVAFFHQFKENPDGDSLQEYKIKHKERILTLKSFNNRRESNNLKLQMDKW